MQWRVDPQGNLHRLYDERLDDGRTLGSLEIRRASHVEPDGESGNWVLDLGPCGGPRIKGFARRSEALAEEVRWIEFHLL